jgi:hypothetical protein
MQKACWASNLGEIVNLVDTRVCFEQRDQRFALCRGRLEKADECEDHLSTAIEIDKGDDGWLNVSDWGFDNAGV